MKETELPPKQPQKQFEVMCCVYKNAGPETAGQTDTTDMSRKKKPPHAPPLPPSCYTVGKTVVETLVPPKLL